MLALLWCYHALAGSNALKARLFSLTTTSTWREFRATSAMQAHSIKKDTWVLVGEIKLKSKDSLLLNELKARWSGGNLGPHVAASLYSKKSRLTQLPIPIEENLICDGVWHPATKEFVFLVQKKLVASDIYYLMINIDKKYEKLLRTGQFEICHHQKRSWLKVKK
jgi:hypothetical protein